MTYTVGDVDVEFDTDKAAANEAKHRVTFEYGLRVFSDARHVRLDVSRLKDQETRLKAIGMIEG